MGTIARISDDRVSSRGLTGVGKASMEPNPPRRNDNLRFRLAVLTGDRIRRAGSLLFGDAGRGFRRWCALPVAVLAVAATGALFAVDARNTNAAQAHPAGGPPGAATAAADLSDSPATPERAPTGRGDASAPGSPGTSRPGSASPSPPLTSTQPPAQPPPSSASRPGPAGPEAGSAERVIPPPATGLTAAPGNGSARICWNPAPNATGYVMYHRDVTTGEGWYRVPYPVTDTCSTVTQLTNGHTYEFKIRSSNANGEADYSGTVQARPAGTIPPPATGLTAAPGNGSARICWNPAPNATGYVMYHRDVTTGEGWYRVPYPVTDTCSTVTQLTNGHTYEFKIRSSNANGEADYSGTAAATPG
ncbi:Fibronectin type III domain protein [Frankia sp. Hr75.2]|nr:Fibronectin type III domain protein [Frankia sp. Hr75.2]